MKILNSLYYYRPHFSGLTVYTERLTKSLVVRGYDVTIVTSQYEPSLPLHEEDEGVFIQRVPVAFFISKGPVMPLFVWTIGRQARKHDVLHLHVPQLAAAPAALLGRMMGKPVILTYHCDLSLPPTWINQLINFASNLLSRIAFAASDVIVTNTRDYAEHSPVLKRKLDKVHAIPPPIQIAPVREEVVSSLRARFQLKTEQKLIGMAARLASEKGAEYLAMALPKIMQEYPQARVLFVGKHEGVVGEEDYAQRLKPILKELGDHWAFLGILTEEELSAFYKLCDVTVLPSVNPTESFGMVQVESMMAGTPVVATDIPGVRSPIRETGMGVIVPPRDSHALANGILSILRAPEAFQSDPERIQSLYGTNAVASAYELLFRKVMKG
ncbi:MAG: glycosyltransferase family 4 protein [Anaerolineales bacterium]|nr:glycosyltransferase family 4 protein [Anaerolineales bacterium]